MRDPYPSETQDRFMVRLPDGMRDKIRVAADAAKRTMSAEIVARLEATFQDDFGVPDFVTGDRIDTLSEDLEALRAEVRALAMKLAETGNPHL